MADAGETLLVVETMPATDAAVRDTGDRWIGGGGGGAAVVEVHGGVWQRCTAQREGHIKNKKTEKNLKD